MFSFLTDDKIIIDNAMDDLLIAKNSAEEKIIEFMRYTAMGGKRLRGILTLEFSKMLGIETEKALPFAVALECVQAYSLIHDDLPCMDNDDLRRGKPSSHIKFGEANAVLSGDALLTYAFSVIAESTVANEHPDRAIKAVEVLSSFAGYKGMVAGQVLDIEFSANKNSVYDISLIHSLKTVALIKAAVKVGCVIAGADNKLHNIAERYANDFGFAFQMADDLEDYRSGKDEESSYVRIYGENKTKMDIYEKITDANSALNEFNDLGYNTEVFKKLLDFLLTKVE